MSNKLTVTIAPDDEPPRWCDWTPPENRVTARVLTVKDDHWYVSLAENERDDPRLMQLYVGLDDARDDSPGEINVEATAVQLDQLIDALTLARDAAIAEWMLEPAK